MEVSALMSRYGRTATRENEPSVNDDIKAEYQERLQHHLQMSRSGVIEEDDDVLLIKYRSVIYPLTFGVGLISDAHLTVRVVKDYAERKIDFRISHAANLMRIFYAGRELKELDVPVREYGVKNNSELVLVMPKGSAPREEEIRVEELEASPRAPERTYSTTYHMRKDVPRSLKPSQRSVKSKTTLAQVDFITISRDNTGDEHARNSASFAFLGSKLKRKRPTITARDLFPDGRERSWPRFIEEEEEEMAEENEPYGETGQVRTMSSPAKRKGNPPNGVQKSLGKTHPRRKQTIYF
ncbi:hypothetical protein F5Y03DRAFT_135489 [Xylaria venustula]|nr:hypothetical protein F5Y03DRAFT_135489 [Xylaria venustula]